MTMTPESDLGFDPHHALAQLKATLLDAGGFPALHSAGLHVYEIVQFLRAVSGIPRTEEEELAALIDVLHPAVVNHIAQHGINAEGPKCRNNPCKVSGICSAIWEISNFIWEYRRYRAVIEMAPHAEKFRAGLEALVPHMVAIDEARCIEPCRLESQGERLLTRTIPTALGRSFSTLISLIREFPDDLNSLLTSPQLQLGAKGEVLLSSVHAALKNGGMTHGEIADLQLTGKPSQSMNNARRAERDRVKKRVKRHYGAFSLSLKMSAPDVDDD